MLLLVSAALFLAAGGLVTRRIEAGPLERGTYAAIAGAAMWLGTTWLLALTHLLDRPALIVRLILVAAFVLFGRRGLPLRLGVSRDLAALIPLILWVAFILWRGAILPPVSHDALSYHLPKATMFAQRGGFDYFPFLIPAIRPLPVNYELLLTEVIVWTGSDDLTEWVSVLFYLLFAVAAAALAERWWKTTRLQSASVLLFAAATPVVLLGSGAHKNDLMVTAFMVSALVAAGRWFADGDRRALWLCIIASALAIGTKPQAAMLAIALAPFIIYRAFKTERALSTLALAVAVTVVSFFALGGAAYVANYTHEGSFLNAKDVDRVSVEIVPYGDWSTLWQGPYVLLAAPFSRDSYSLSVPWESRPWFWRRYEIYFSHLGVIFSLAAVALPFALLRSRGRAGLEHAAISIAVLLTLVVILPVGFRPHGLYTISLPRYALFIVPVVLAWTIAPLAARFGVPVLVAAAATFTVYGVQCAIHDAFAPLSYVKWAHANPGTRVVMFDPNRAASVADRAAGPREKIAIDAGFGTWIQPAFGRDLRRPVEFIPGGDGPPLITEDTRWVAIDRAYTAVWQHPEFDDLSEARQFLLRGQPSARDLRVFNTLRRDGRFELVFYNPRTVQAVFHRVR